MEYGNGKGTLFKVLGVLFLLFAILIFKINSLDSPFGTIFLNLFLIAMDCLWLVGTGLFLILTGFQILKSKQLKPRDVKLGQYFCLFNLNFIIFSFIFNQLGEPVAETNGRIFTYCLQSMVRVVKPAFSADFIVPFTGFICFIILIIVFKQMQSVK